MSKKLAPWLPAVVIVGLAGAGLWLQYRGDARNAKVDTACIDAAILTQVGLLNQAQRAAARLKKEKHLPSCPDVAAQVRALRAQSTGRFDEARSLRRAAHFSRRGVTKRRVRKWRRAAFDAYLQGLALDPASAGARRGLRALLRSGSPRSPYKTRRHCTQARRLLDARLQREARAEYLRVRAAGRVCVDEIRATLRTRRTVAYTWLREAEALDRADDRTGARRQYLAALAIDPSLANAVAGLDRTQPEIPDAVSLGDVAKLPALFSLAAFLVVAAATIAFILGAGLVRILRGVGRRGWFAPLYRWPPLRKLITEALDIVATKQLSGLQWAALLRAKGVLGESAVPGDPYGLPTELWPVPGGPAQSADLAAVPLLDKLDRLHRFARSISGGRRASISVEPVGDDAFNVFPWMTADDCPRGATVPVAVPGGGAPMADDLGDRLAFAILVQRGSA